MAFPACASIFSVLKRVKASLIERWDCADVALKLATEGFRAMNTGLMQLARY